MDNKRWLCDICGLAVVTNGSLQRHIGRRHSLMARSVTEQATTVAHETIQITRSVGLASNVVTSRLSTEGPPASDDGDEIPSMVPPLRLARTIDFDEDDESSNFPMTGSNDPAWFESAPIEEPEFPFRPDADETLLDFESWMNSVQPNLEGELVDEEAIANIVFDARFLVFPMEWEDFRMRMRAQWPLCLKAVLRGVYHGFMQRTEGENNPLFVPPPFMDGR